VSSLATKKRGRASKKEEKMEKKQVKKTKSKEVKVPEGTILYSIDQIYKKGDKIYHSVWDDVGIVENIGETEDGVKKIEVRFEKEGEKKLVMGYEA